MTLFYGADLRDWLEAKRRAVVAEVERWEPNQLLAQSETEIVRYLVDRYSVQPLVIDVDARYADEPSDIGEMVQGSQGPIRIPATRLVIHVPFTGDPELFQMQASTFTYNPPRAAVSDGELLFVYDQREFDPAAVMDQLENELRKINEQVSWTNTDVAAHNQQLDGLAGAEVTKRKEKLLRDRQLTAGLGIPVRRRGDAPPTPVPVHRRRVRVERPAAVSSDFVPEYAIDDEAYAEAVRVIVGFGRQLERTPATTAKLDEEELRDLFLGALNTQFEGQAGGELFNGSGKTDILIRVEDRSVFIAECKFWHGSKLFDEAVDQLFSYLVWRDTKAAIMLFIRAKDATAIIEKAAEVLRARATRTLTPVEPVERRDFVLVADDVQREVKVALLPFVLRESA